MCAFLCNALTVLAKNSASYYEATGMMKSGGIFLYTSCRGGFRQPTQFASQATDTVRENLAASWRDTQTARQSTRQIIIWL